MDLSRGICVICLNNTKIVTPPQAKNITSLVKKILADQVDFEKFGEVNSSLRICPVCLHDIKTAADLMKNIKSDYSENTKRCFLCHDNEFLVAIHEWSHFDTLVENVKNKKRPRKCSTCLNCIKCLELLAKIKANLFRKYPVLDASIHKNNAVKAKTPVSKHGPIKKVKEKPLKHVDDSDDDDDGDDKPVLSRRHRHLVNNIKTALRHLKPLKNSKFRVEEYRRDKKLFKQVAFVNLTVSNLSRSTTNLEDVTPKRNARPKRSVILSDVETSPPSPKQSFFKIKLKANLNKTKAQKALTGKVTKVLPSKNKSYSLDKELVVRIYKMDAPEFIAVEDSFEKEPTPEVKKTPTKASRKMMPEDPLSSSKKRKSVTFADVPVEITDGTTNKDNDLGTPLKSSLKKSISPIMDLLANDISETQKKKPSLSISDSEEETETVDDLLKKIQENNDDIFNSLKSSPKKNKVEESNSSKRRRNDSSSSNDESDKNEETSENIYSKQQEQEDDTVSKKKHVPKTPKKRHVKNTENNISNDLGSDQEDLEPEKEETSTINEPKEVITNNEIKDGEEYCGSTEDSTSPVKDKNTPLLRLGDDADDIVPNTEDDQITLKEYKTRHSHSENPEASDLVTLKEYKRISSECQNLENEEIDNGALEEDQADELVENVEKEVGDNELPNNDLHVNNEMAVEEKESNLDDHEDNSTSNVILEENGKESDDSVKEIEINGNSSPSKGKKRRRSTLEEEDDENQLSRKIREDNDILEPETKKEKVSEVNELESNKNGVTEDESEQTLETHVNLNTTDIDDIVTKYSNPDNSNLDNDNNVSDREIAESSGETERQGIEEPSDRAEEELGSKNVINDLESELIDKNLEKDDYDNIIDSNIEDCDFQV